MRPLTVVRHTKGLALSLTYFEYPTEDAEVDVEVAVQVAAPREGWESDEFHTLLVELAGDEDALWRGVQTSCRQEIRRADERDGVTLAITDTPGEEELRTFHGFHAAAARERGRGPADLAALRELRARGGLSLGRVEAAGERVLAWHAHVVSNRRARLLLSAISRDVGSDRAMVGRANRLLHWKEMLHFREAGLGTYDFGGVSLASPDKPVAGVDAFKRLFGGKPVREYKSRRARSAIGRVALGAARMPRARRLVEALTGSRKEAGSR